MTYSIPNLVFLQQLAAHARTPELEIAQALSGARSESVFRRGRFQLCEPKATQVVRCTRCWAATRSRLG